MIVSDVLFLVSFGFNPFKGGFWRCWHLEKLKTIVVIIGFEYVG